MSHDTAVAVDTELLGQSRWAEIHIVNDLPYPIEWDKDEDNFNHGKLEKDPDPKTADPGQITRFKVKNRSDAMLGPDGHVAYKYHDASGEKVIIKVYFHHPWSQHTSSYSVNTDPEGKVIASQKPADPSGHGQVIYFYIREAP